MNLIFDVMDKNWKEDNNDYTILITDVASFRKELTKMIEQVRYDIGEYSVGSSSQIAERFECNIKNL